MTKICLLVLFKIGVKLLALKHQNTEYLLEDKFSRLRVVLFPTHWGHFSVVEIFPTKLTARLYHIHARAGLSLENPWIVDCWSRIQWMSILPPSQQFQSTEG